MAYIIWFLYVLFAQIYYIFSHQNVEQSGYLHHKIARRIYSIVWAVCSDNVLYLYQSISDSITMDVICLQSYRPRANLNRAPKDKFKFKLEQRVSDLFTFGLYKIRNSGRRTNRTMNPKTVP